MQQTQHLQDGPGVVAGVRERLMRAHIDITLIFLLIAICSIGLMILYSASGHDMGKVISQATRMIMGLLVMIMVAQIPPVWFRYIAPTMYLIGAFLLVLVLLIGINVNGSTRWLNFGFQFQPSEIMKLVIGCTVATILHGGTLPPRWGNLLLAAIVIAIPAALIAKQPDLGTALLTVVSGGFVIYMAGLRWKVIFLLIVVAVSITPLAWLKMHDYQRKRVEIFLNPDLDPAGAGYHIAQSKIAIGSGGVFGKGLGEGTQGHLEFLPESETDFVFAVYSEETGLVGFIVLLVLYLCVVGRGIMMALRAQDNFARLVISSFVLTFFTYVFINMGMVLGLLPVVGVPLPFLSYGGTSVVTLFTGFGIVMSLHTHRTVVT